MGKTKNFYKVVISHRAADMLLHHVRFVAQVSSQAADHLREEIIEAMKSFKDFPERNMNLTDPMLPVGKYRKLIINKRYLIIYQIKSDTVYVEYIVDCRQDYQWLI